MRRRALAVVAFLLSGLVASCNRCPIVDYTVPPTPAVLGTADAVVIATVGGIGAVGDGRIEADIAVTDVLFTHPDHEILSEGPLRVGAYDDPCSRRSGMTLADGGSLVVVLRWVDVDDGSSA
ncbi:MAG: hypothetical protein HKN91_10860 [Acidimicrobiia bacterium]|nr:hypothetical protein [Acidimicrobiia bacterium]